MNNLLKEAIADAKAVRETALANAKLALEEAFTPRIQSMLSAKLAEDEEMGYEEEPVAEDEAPLEEPVEAEVEVEVEPEMEAPVEEDEEMMDAPAPEEAPVEEPVAEEEEPAERLDFEAALHVQARHPPENHAAGSSGDLAPSLSSIDCRRRGLTGY